MYQNEGIQKTQPEVIVGLGDDTEFIEKQRETKRFALRV